MDSLNLHQQTQAGKDIAPSPIKHFADMLLPMEESENDSAGTTASGFAAFLEYLKDCAIEVQETDGRMCPSEALMHDRAAIVPSVVISPKSEWGVAQTLRLLKAFGLYDRSVSVKSGGHGYFNGGTCPDIMLDLSSMSKRWIDNDILHLEPGCVLGQTIDILAKHGKAVPHGDCFGVGAGGHFLTAGWDVLLTRLFGLGCQSVVGGRIVLWDSTIVEVSEKSHRDLLYAMRGGAAAGVGVVTEIHLRLQEEPARATWKFTPITKEQLKDICVAYGAFSKAHMLPREISVSFRFHYEPGQEQPCCSFNIVSILSAEETIRHLRQHLGREISSLVSDVSCWNEKSLMDLRLLPASDTLAANPGMLGEATAKSMHTDPQTFWSEKWCMREMARSYFTSISHWITPDCEAIFPDVYTAFEAAKNHPCRERMSALAIVGGGRMSELDCAMSMGRDIFRFEQHWDIPGQEEWCRDITKKISDIIQTKADTVPERPYRGDIWQAEQAQDPLLDGILAKYETRHDGSCSSSSCTDG